MFQGRLVNLSCSSVPSFVVSITSTTQVQKEITRSVYASLVSASEERGENKPERQCGTTLCKDIFIMQTLSVLRSKQFSKSVA